MRLALKALPALLLVIASACGDNGDAVSPTTSETTAATTSTTEVALPGGDLEPCESPEGFTISKPVSWETNSGDVVAPCGQFNPEPFEVERGTDKRVAAITAYIDPVPFATASRPRDGSDADRAVTAVDGRQAVRLHYEVSGESLYPTGTPITAYIVDLGELDGRDRTLFINTLGLGDWDYETNVVILDRMARTLEITHPDVDADPAMIAAYRGGGGGFSVVVEQTNGELCLRVPPEGEPVCTEPPDADQVHTIQLPDLDRTIPAGITGERVWRVDLFTAEGDEHSYLPSDVAEAELGAYAFSDTVPGFERLVLRDVTGEELRTVEPGEA